MSECFGALLRRLRLATVVTVARTNQSARWPVTGAISQNELAFRAGINPAYVNKAEAGVRLHPSRRVVLQLASALDLDDLDTALLLVSAGHWPWPDLDDDDLARVVGIATAVVEGDYRVLSEAVP